MFLLPLYSIPISHSAKLLMELSKLSDDSSAQSSLELSFEIHSTTFRNPCCFKIDEGDRLTV